MPRVRLPFPMPRRRRSSPGAGQAGHGRRTSFKTRLILALVLAAFALISYYGKPGDRNQVTGEVEKVAMIDEEQEIQLGLQAAPEMVQQHGGVSNDAGAKQLVHTVGLRLLDALDQELREKNASNPQLQLSNPYYDAFRFTLLADPKVVNAFALPGGQVFITEALFEDLKTEGQLAGVLGHEIGHVLARHGNKRMAKQGLFQGLAGAAGVLGGTEESARAAQMISAVVSMKYGREDELESDKWGVRLCAMSGYDPRAMIGLMEVLDAASGGQAPPEFFSTHPKPANRVDYIKKVINQEFPNGVPEGLRP